MPWLVVSVRRDARGGFTAPAHDRVVRLTPRALPPEAALALAEAATDSAPVPPHRLQLAVERSGGNPQLLRDLLRSVGAGEETLPDSIETAALARVDRLAPEERTLVRRAAVLGVAFHPRHLADVLDRRVTLMLGTFTDPVYPELLVAAALLLIAGFARRAAVLSWFGTAWAARCGFLGAVAGIWRGGCIIRAAFLDRIREAFGADPGLPTLLAAPHFAQALGRAQASWRRVVATGASQGIPVPGFAAALCYYDSLRARRLPASLVQAQRDYFGAHTYRRVDRDGAFHTPGGQDGAEDRAG